MVPEDVDPGGDDVPEEPLVSEYEAVAVEMQEQTAMVVMAHLQEEAVAEVLQEQTVVV